MNYKGAIFDLDGTLIDSMGVWRQIDIDFLKKRGYEATMDYTSAIAHMGVDENASYTKKRYNLNESEEDIKNEWYDMAIEAYSNTIRLKKGVYEYLTHLNRQNVKMAIATASEQDLVIPVLRNNKILDLFENITTIKEVKRSKGNPDVYIKCAEKMNLKINECMVFEDILEGVKGAKKGGFYTVAVYDYWAEKSRNEIIEKADRYIRDFTELI